MGTLVNLKFKNKKINNAKDSIVINRSSIEKFKADDFIRESGEIFAVKEKPREVIIRIAKIIKEEKAKPQAEGRLLVTRYDIYFIKRKDFRWTYSTVFN